MHAIGCLADCNNFGEEHQEVSSCDKNWIGQQPVNMIELIKTVLSASLQDGTLVMS
jgi:hypothetical protein